MTDLLSLTPDELTALLLDIGEPKYRAAQMFPQLHRGISPDEMTNIGRRGAGLPPWQSTACRTCGANWSAGWTGLSSTCSGWRTATAWSLSS